MCRLAVLYTQLQELSPCSFLGFSWPQPHSSWLVPLPQGRYLKYCLPLEVKLIGTRCRTECFFLCFWVSTALLLRDFTPSFQVSRTSGLCSQRLCHGDSPRFWEGPPLRCSRLTSLLRLCSSVCWISSATAQVTAPRTAPQLNQRATERAGSLTEPPMLPGDEAGMS